MTATRRPFTRVPLTANFSPTRLTNRAVVDRDSSRSRRAVVRATLESRNSTWRRCLSFWSLHFWAISFSARVFDVAAAAAFVPAVAVIVSGSDGSVGELDSSSTRTTTHSNPTLHGKHRPGRFCGPARRFTLALRNHTLSWCSRAPIAVESAR